VIPLAEVDIQGVSSRKFKATSKQLCGVEVSAVQDSRAVDPLDDMRLE
jgi:transposase-like protein